MARKRKYSRDWHALVAADQNYGASSSAKRKKKKKRINSNSASAKSGSSSSRRDRSNSFASVTSTNGYHPTQLAYLEEKRKQNRYNVEEKRNKKNKKSSNIGKRKGNGAINKEAFGKFLRDQPSTPTNNLSQHHNKTKNQKNWKNLPPSRKTFQLQLPSLKGSKSASLVPWMRPKYSQNNKKKNTKTTQTSATTGTAAAAGSNTTEQKNRSNSHNNNNNVMSRRRLPTDACAVSTLERLDEELLAFSNYVRLTETERAARDKVVSIFDKHAKNLFSSSRPSSSRNPNINNQNFHNNPYCDSTTANNNSDNVQEAEVPCARVFGSYATQEVCSFNSDVDLALWGVVPPDSPPFSSSLLLSSTGKHHRFTTTTTDNNKKKRLRSTADLPVASNDDNQKNKESSNSSSGDSNGSDDIGCRANKKSRKLSPKEEKLKKWREVLATLDDAEEDAARTTATTTTTTTTKTKELAINSAASPPPAPSEPPLFTIDRFGGANDHEQFRDAEETAAVSPSPCSVVDVTVGDDDRENSYHHHRMSATVKGGNDDNDNNNVEKETNKNNSSDNPYNLLKTCSSSSSDDDTADELEGYMARSSRPLASETEETASSSRVTESSSDKDKEESDGSEANTVDLTTIDTDSDDSSRYDDASSDEAMEVNFTVPVDKPNMAPATNLLSGPSGRSRIKVVDALSQMRNRLRRDGQRLNCRPTSIQLIKHARVPILKMGTPFGFEMDVAVGGHNGADTSHFAASQVRRYQSFGAVVLLLKVLLAQQDLDKPFTGGIGSYKLYVMVAYHLQQHLALGGTDRPGEVLMAFLFRFGHVYGHNVDDQTRTKLTKNTALQYCYRKGRDNDNHDSCNSDGDDNGLVAAEADLSNVFMLEQCMHLFQKSWERLWARMRLGSSIKDGDSETGCAGANARNKRESLLMDLIDTKRLHTERQECKRMATFAEQQHNTTGGDHRRKRPFPDRNVSSHKRRRM